MRNLILVLAIVCFYSGNTYEMFSNDITIRGTFDENTGKIKTSDFVSMKSSAPEYVCLREDSEAKFKDCIDKETKKAEKEFNRWYLYDFRKKGNLFKPFLGCKKR
jgi:hypothetical protein